MTIHRVESFVDVGGERTLVAFCGVEVRDPLPRLPQSMTVTPGKANCEACAAKMDEVSRAEWAAVKP